MVFFIPAGGKGLICGAGSARSRRGRHTLRCRCIPARGGRRPTLSSPPLSVRTQAHAVLPGSCRSRHSPTLFILRRRSGPSARSLRWRSSSKGDLICAAFLFAPFGADHTLRCRGSFIFLFSFYGILLHWRLHFSFWPAKIEKRSKEKSAAHVRALKNRTGHYPPRNSRAEWKSSFRVIYEYPTMSDARSDKPTADATGRFFSRSAGTGLRSKGRGAAPVLVCVVHPCGRTSRMGVYFLIEGAGPHKNSVCVQNIRPSPFLEHELHGLRHSFRPPGKSVGRERGRRHASPA